MLRGRLQIGGRSGSSPALHGHRRGFGPVRRMSRTDDHSTLALTGPGFGLRDLMPFDRYRLEL